MVVKTHIVKCSLSTVIAAEHRDAFRKIVESCVTRISRSLRQASIGMLAFVTWMCEHDMYDQLPPLMSYEKNCQYWRDWLELNRAGIERVHNDSGKPGIPDEIWKIIEDYVRDDEIVEIVNTKTSRDQAAVQFATAIQNNAYIPLVPRLTRLTKLRIMKENSKGVKTSDLMTRIRSAQNHDNSDLPEWARKHVTEVRGWLGMPVDSYFYDDSGKCFSFAHLIKLNYNIQKALESINGRRISLSPVFSVRRQHVRFTQLHLLEIAKAIIRPPAKCTYKLRCDECDQNGRRRPKCLECSQLNDIYTKARATYKSMIPPKSIEKKPRKIMVKPCQNCNQCTNSIRECMVCNCEGRDAIKMPLKHLCSSCAHAKKYMKNCEVCNTAREEASIVFNNQKEAYNMSESVAKEKEMNDDLLWCLFNKQCRILRTNRDKFSFSIMTDGAAVSLQLETNEEITQPTIARTIKDDPVVKVDDYDRNLVLVHCSDEGVKTLFPACDPGLENIATVAMIDPVNGKTVWKLGKKTYYNESGINKQKFLKNKWATGIRTKLSQLGNINRSDYVHLKCKVYEATDDDVDHVEVSLNIANEDNVDAALRSSKICVIKRYLSKYSEIRSEWWKKELLLRESRIRFSTYIGKRRVLDKFWSNIKNELRVKFPDFRIRMQYGSATLSMKPGMKGCTSVPVTGTFKSCNRMFETDVVYEAYTTKINWYHGKENRKVYRKSMTSTGKVTLKKAEGEKNEYGHVHPIRGLLASPNSACFLDRDVEAALNIGRLGLMKHTCNTRPVCFCHSQRNVQCS